MYISPSVWEPLGLPRVLAGTSFNCALPPLNCPPIPLKLRPLDEERKTAKEALEALKLKRGRLEDLEQDAETLLTSYASMVPEGLDALSLEERQRLYKMLRLKVYTYAGGGTEVDGTFVVGDGFYGRNGSSRPDARLVGSERPRFCTSKMGRIWLSSPLMVGRPNTPPGT
jgi:hypothetical protein